MIEYIYIYINRGEEGMDSGRRRSRTNVEGDKLSMLPDDVIHKILSFISIKYAVQTSVLSSRWRFTWTSMPYLNISDDDFPDLSDFVNHVLCSRSTQIEVYWVKISFRKAFSKVLLKTVLDYAFSHNVQQVTVSYFREEKIDFPLHLFHSGSLKYLRLTGSAASFKRLHDDPYSIILASTWDLPALTTLHLDNVIFHEDKCDNGLFSACPNLKNLTLNKFTVLKSCSFTVFHPQLSSLTLEHDFWTLDVVNVVAPQLQNLTIRSCVGQHLIDAPNLVSLVVNSSELEFSTDLPSLEKADLCIHPVYDWNARQIFGLLRRFQNIKFLTLNLEFIKPLSLYMERIPQQPSPFSNLKSLKIYPNYVPSEDRKRVILSSEVIKYLLDGSPSAIFTLISYEEVAEKERKARAIKNAGAAEKLMESLQVWLERKRSTVERDRGHMEQTPDTNDEGKAEIGKTEVQFERKMRQMERCWEDLSEQIDRGRRDTSYIISSLHEIEVLLLKEVPASKRDELQACYSRLRAEADSVVKKILHDMKTLQMQLSDCFSYELATTSMWSSSQQAVSFRFLVYAEVIIL